jgi:hypothetical protein
VRFEVDAPPNYWSMNATARCAAASATCISSCRRLDSACSRAATLTTYTFNTGTAKHHFCATCGVKSFYVPRSHPDGFSVNARCIDSPTVTGMKISHVDGRNWEQHYPAGRGEFTA